MKKPKNSTLKKLALGQTAAIGVIGVTILFSQGCAYHEGGAMKSEAMKPHMSKMKSKTVKDGEIAVPENYRDWPKFVATVDKEKGGQVREIYINSTGITAKKGEAFPFGTQTVMEIYSARKTASGEVAKDGNGRLIKDGLSRIFVMEKGKGWGAHQPDGVVDNGDWVYGAYMMDGKTPATKDFSACRACHLPLKDDDFIARYDEHFAYK